MSKTYPWEYHSDLTAERLITVARLIADGRQAAVERFDEEVGDNGWTLGVNAYQYARARIIRNSQSGEYDWLKVIDKTLRLIFKIGAVPMRIYKGPAEEPTDRTVNRSYREQQQLSFLFDHDDEDQDLTYRFAVEPNVDGSVIAVKFVAIRGNDAVFNWDIPLYGDLQSVGTVGRQATETVELDAPTVAVRSAVTKKHLDSAD